MRIPRLTPGPRARGLLILASVLSAAPAFALQPLSDFLSGASGRSPDLHESEANFSTQQDQEQTNLGRLLPSLAVRGSYTRNQYDASLSLDLTALHGPKINEILTPYNQLNGQITINVPLVDLASWQRYRQSKLGIEGARQAERATALQVQAQVVQQYYQLVANLAVVTTAQKALDVSKASQQTTADKFQAGTASQLDVDRANAEVETHVQQVAATHLQVLLAQRSLETLSGITADLAELPIRDDLHAEPALDQWAPPDADLPAVQATVIARLNGEQTLQAARLSLAPTLSGNLNEYLANVPGFIGHEEYWTAGLALTWNLDYSTWATIHLQQSQLAAASAREDRARLAARDAIYRFWNTVQSDLELSRSTRTQAQVSTHAAELAQDRYAAGVATQLDLLQAQRDAFAAEVSRIQADADLINARAQLRLAAGHSLLPEGSSP
jgi:outer membrane protein TolC